MRPPKLSRVARSLVLVVSKPTSQAIADAAQRLKAGGLVVFPTETVYGLGACVFNEAAVAQVFTLKGRPASNPMIVHVASTEDAPTVAACWDDRCKALSRAFWPGPLTIVTTRNSSVPSLVTGGRSTVAIRSPSHPTAQALLTAVGEPLAAPSANRSGHVSATTGQHVADDFPDTPLMILDGGATNVGIESTVIDLSGPPELPATILRQGSILASELQAVIGPVCVKQTLTQDASPGTSAKHYAPRVPLHVVEADQLKKTLAQASGDMAVLVFDKNQVDPPHTELIMPSEPLGYQKALYDQLRRGEDCDGIVVVAPPKGEQWDAIHDRLQRAST